MKLLILMALGLTVTLLGCSVGSSAGSRQDGPDNAQSVEFFTLSNPKLNVVPEDVGDLEDLPKISTSLERLFRLVPEQMAGSTPVFFNDYAVIRSVPGLESPGTAASSDSRSGDAAVPGTEQGSAFSSTFPAPWISGLGQYRDNFPGYPYLGLDSRSIGSSLRLGEATEAYEVVAAPIETETVVRNIEGCDECPPVSIDRIGETASLNWDDTLAGDINRRFAPPFFDQFGRAGTLVVGNGYTIRFPKSVENDAMSLTIAGQPGSKSSGGLSESALYRPVIDALSRFQVLTARISTDGRPDPVMDSMADGFVSKIVATADVTNHGGAGARGVVAVIVFEDDGDRDRNQRIVVSKLSNGVRDGEIFLENQKEIGEASVELWRSGPVYVALIQDAFLLKKEHLLRPPMPGLFTVSDDQNHSPPSVEVAFDLADFVFEGVVQAPRDARWTTEDGKRPSVGDDEIFDNPEITIVTPFPITVERIFKGKFEESEITYFLAGGQVGEDSFTFQSDFDFVREGMQAVFFLRKRRSMNGVMESNQMIERYELDAIGTASGRYEETTLQNIKLYAISFSDDQ